MDHDHQKINKSNDVWQNITATADKSSSSDSTVLLYVCRISHSNNPSYVSNQTGFPVYRTLTFTAQKIDTGYWAITLDSPLWTTAPFDIPELLLFEQHAYRLSPSRIDCHCAPNSLSAYTESLLALVNERRKLENVHLQASNLLSSTRMQFRGAYVKAKPSNTLDVFLFQ